MEIEFNPNRIPPQAGYSEPVARRSGPRATPTEAESQPNVTGLEDKLKSLPLTRPEKVLAVKPLASNLKYPPDELLDRIATLLAVQYR